MNKTVLITLSAIFTIISAGCDNQSVQRQPEKKYEKLAYTPTELEKARLQRKLETKFENPQVHYDLAEIYRNDGMWDKAMYHYNLALRFEPSRADAKAAIIKLYRMKGQPERAAIAADIYMNQAAASAEKLLLLGNAFRKHGLEELAFKSYQEALKLAPNSAALHRQIGYYYLSKGDQVRAREAFRRSFDIDPYNADVAGQLGKMGVIIQMPRKDSEREAEKLDKMLKEQSQPQSQQQ